VRARPHLEVPLIQFGYSIPLQGKDLDLAVRIETW
jgi:hypothetical protein